MWSKLGNIISEERRVLGRVSIDGTRHDSAESITWHYDLENQMKPSLTPSKKTFQKEGKWIEKQNAAVILCVCGNKYIKTRDRQTMCVRCLSNRTP